MCGSSDARCGVQVAFVTFALVFSPMWMRMLTFSERAAPKAAFLDPQRWQQLPLVKKEQLSHNSRRFRHVRLPPRRSSHSRPG